MTDDRKRFKVERRMSKITTYTKPLTATQAENLKAVMLERGFRFEPKPYCLYSAAGANVNVAVYEKGPKVVVQGKGTEDFITFALEPEVFGVAELGYEEVISPQMFEPHIGVDESGKGDYFGPLVIAGAYVNRETARALQDIGVMDSKRISTDSRISAIAQAMRGIRGFVHEEIVISPEKYNQLYAKFGNLNKLLAWGHAQVIENLLERVPDCPRALSDQFANPKVLQAALKERGKAIILEQRTKAESDLAVAAASILAREKFVHWLMESGRKWEILLPKGVSQMVKDNAAAFIVKHGQNHLEKVAKMHFKTTQELI